MQCDRVKTDKKLAKRGFLQNSRDGDTRLCDGDTKKMNR